jgi:hypothetical protein
VSPSMTAKSNLVGRRQPVRTSGDNPSFEPPPSGSAGARRSVALSLAPVGRTARAQLAWPPSAAARSAGSPRTAPRAERPARYRASSPRAVGPAIGVRGDRCRAEPAASRQITGGRR